MASSATSAKLAKFVLFVVVLILLAFSIYWLWQRQPKIQNQEKSKEIESIHSQTEPVTNSSIKPPNFSVLSDNIAKIAGKASPDSLVAIFSNSNSTVTQTEANGNFETDFELTEGLNQIAIVTFSKSDLAPTNTKYIDYYLKNGKEKLPEKAVLYSGPVKSIFDTLTTVSTTEGDKKAQTKKTSELLLPEDEEETNATTSALSGIRIGDFAIALGTVDKEGAMSIQKLQIMRDPKPQISKSIVAVKILKEPKSNLFSANNLKDNKIIEFNLNKNSLVYINDQKAETKSILKEKRAVIFFEKEKDKNIAGFVYILP